MNVVPLSELDAVVDETIARVIRGLALARARDPSINVDMPAKIDFTFNISRDSGINAVARTQTAGPAVRTSTANEPEQVKTSVRGAVQSESTTTKAAETVQESSSQDTHGTDLQVNTYGRSNDTLITYET